ncbi:hypothetical protein MJI69_28015, partial [Salmonella enterica subsp. enterica serovar Anatum]|nr:hypothetical protein [Salmonella enterica subsp. enterica serovar Anatum]
MQRVSAGRQFNTETGGRFTVNARYNVPAFWENKGKGIARRNLWISVSCLLLAFCVWMLFSAVAVNLNK